MEHIERLRESLPDIARDIKLNLVNVLSQSTLNTDQIWGTAIASAFTTRNKTLSDAVLAQARAAGASDGAIEDGKAAAVLMAMNNVYYRFRHIVGKEDYSQKPARLRMQRINQVTSNKADFELFCIAVSALGNCQACIQSHEATVLEHGLSTDQIHDSVRIAAVINAAATALALV